MIRSARDKYRADVARRIGRIPGLAGAQGCKRTKFRYHIAFCDFVSVFGWNNGKFPFTLPPDTP